MPSTNPKKFSIRDVCDACPPVRLPRSTPSTAHRKRHTRRRQARPGPRPRSRGRSVRARRRCEPPGLDQRGDGHRAEHIVAVDQRRRLHASHSPSARSVSASGDPASSSSCGWAMRVRSPTRCASGSRRVPTSWTVAGLGSCVDGSSVRVGHEPLTHRAASGTNAGPVDRVGCTRIERYRHRQDTASHVCAGSRA